MLSISLPQRGSFVGEVEEQYGGESRDEEDDIKPAVIEAELQLSQHLGDNDPVLWRHVHTHQ